MATMYNNNLWAVTLVVGVICAVLAAVIARRKNRNVQEAVAVGAFLGVIGLLIVALLPSKAPAGMGKVVCLRCNKRQNVPSCQTTFECWQCKLVAQTPWSVGAGPSKGYVDDVIRNVRHGKRPAILLYAGDHDPSGWDIPRDFIARTDCWKHVERIALTPEQIAQYGLPEALGKETDSRKTGFIEQFGALVQVELDALDPDVLRGLYADAIEPLWDTSAYEAVLAREAEERDELAALAARYAGGR